MQALLDHLAACPLPLNDRPNVSPHVPCRSLTLGLVNQRQMGYGISHATTRDNMRLLRVLLALIADPQINGERPSSSCFTSLTVNVGYGCELHTDARNDRDTPSRICAVGEFEGGEIWVEKEPEHEREKPHAVTCLLYTSPSPRD